MRRFFLTFLRNLTAMLLACVVLVILVLGFVGALAVYFEGEPLEVPEEGVLVFDLSLSIPDAPHAFAPDEAFLAAFDPTADSVMPLKRLIDTLDRAANDDRIKALLFKGNYPDSLDCGLTTVNEVRAAVARFKQSGKPVFAYLQSAGEKDYLLASMADKVFIHPLCTLDISGFSIERLYLGRAFDQFGVKAQPVVIGNYKSAIDTFTRSSMTPYDREQLSELVGIGWEEFAKGVAENRNLDPGRVTELSSTKGFLTPDEAVAAGLVDGVTHQGDVQEAIDKALGLGADDDSFPAIGLVNYWRATQPVTPSTSDPSIAVVYVEGEIVDGRGRSDQAGAERIVGDLEQVMFDDDVRAVVVRINSPGGSAVASEAIRGAIERLKDRCPVIVSMGHMAASGGYWVASSGDEIYAEPSTITGSIGIFSLFFDVSELANDLGVTSDIVKSGPMAGGFSLMQGASQPFLERMYEQTEEDYDFFIRIVSEGRNIPAEQVRSIAQGRVWMGRMALEQGLVDKMGGLEAAIARAGELAGMGSFPAVKEMPARFGLEEMVSRYLDAVSVKVRGPDISAKLRAKEWAEEVERLTSHEGSWARLPIYGRFDF